MQGTLASARLPICVKHYQKIQKAFEERKVQISDPFTSHCPGGVETSFCELILLGSKPLHGRLKEVKRHLRLALLPGEKSVDEKAISCRHGKTYRFLRNNC